MIQVTYSDLEYAVMHGKAHRTTVMPRYTPVKWWENDVCEVTHAGYWREYEIKMSRADFFVDAKKAQHNRNWQEGTFGTDRKHDLLARGDPAGPSQFWFVTPQGLVQPHEVPQWAGLIEVWRHKHSNYPQSTEITRAPRLHENKVDDKFIRAMVGCAYGRIHHIFDQQYYRSLCKRMETIK